MRAKHLFQIRADLVRQLLVGRGVLDHAQALLDDAPVDGTPVGEGGQLGVGHGSPDHPEDRGEGSVRGIGNGGDDGVGQAVYVGGDAQQHGAPAFRADGGIGGEHVIGDGSVFENGVQIRGVGVPEEGPGSVHADQKYVLVPHGVSFPFVLAAEFVRRPPSPVRRSYLTPSRRKSQAERIKRPGRRGCKIFCEKFFGKTKQSCEYPLNSPSRCAILGTVTWKCCDILKGESP